MHGAKQKGSFLKNDSPCQSTVHELRACSVANAMAKLAIHLALNQA